MSYFNQLIKRYKQLENRLCSFEDDGHIVIERGDYGDIQPEECTEEELEELVEHLEDLHFNGTKLMFCEQCYDQPSTDSYTFRTYDYVLDVETKTYDYRITHEDVRGVHVHLFKPETVSGTSDSRDITVLNYYVKDKK